VLLPVVELKVPPGHGMGALLPAGQSEKRAEECTGIQGRRSSQHSQDPCGQMMLN